jgi:hypothetical protein
LLVVISIIAILLAVLMPALGKAREQAKAVTCVSQKKQWGVVMTTFTMDNDGYFEGGYANEVTGVQQGWWELLYPYYKGMPDIIFCSKTAHDNSKNKANDITYNVWTRDVKAATGNTLGSSVGKIYYGSIGKNTRLVSYVKKDTDPALYYKKVSDIPQTSKVPVFYDSAWMDGYFTTTNGVTNHYPPLYKGAFDKSSGPETAPTDDDVDGYKAPYGGCRFTLNRHGDKKQGFTSVVFVDGSARRVHLKELWVLKWNKVYDTRATMKLGRWPDWMRTFKDFGTPLNIASKGG